MFRENKTRFQPSDYFVICLYIELFNGGSSLLFFFRNKKCMWATSAAEGRFPNARYYMYRISRFIYQYDTSCLKKYEEINIISTAWNFLRLLDKSHTTYWAWSDWADAKAEPSSLGAQSFYWFCHEAAHMSIASPESNIQRYLSRSITKPTKWPMRPTKTRISLGIIFMRTAKTLIRLFIPLHAFYSSFLLVPIVALPWDLLSRDMTKPTKWVCAQRRLRSAWASAQSDQNLRCPHEESLGP